MRGLIGFTRNIKVYPSDENEVAKKMCAAITHRGPDSEGIWWDESAPLVLGDSPWERGKCGCKLIQYMACGVPVIASPVGVNSEIVSDGITGYLAVNSEQWHQALRKLISENTERVTMGKAGREKVENWYSSRVQAPRFYSVVQSVEAKSRE